MNAVAAAVPEVETRAEILQLFPTRLTTARAMRSIEKADFFIMLAILGDLGVLLGGLALGYWIRFASGWITFGVEAPNMTFPQYAGPIMLGAVFQLLTFGYLQLYARHRMLNYRETAQVVFKGLTLWLVAFLAIRMMIKIEPHISRIYAVCSYAACLGAMLGWRWMFSQLLHTQAVSKTLRQRILFVGWAAPADRLCRYIAKDPNHPYEVAGWVPAQSGRRDLVPKNDVPYLQDGSPLPAVLHRHQIDVVVVADLGMDYEEILDLSNVCEKELVQFKIIPSYFQILLSGLKLEPVSGVPVLGVTELPLDRLLNRSLKRTVDILGAMAGLCCSVPVVAMFGALIYFEERGPIFYSQVRTGRNGKPFKIYKLRTMRLDAESQTGPQWARMNDPRCLKVGSILRKYHLDEVPQFWNVLKGEMSLVGPRPERPELIANFRHQIPHYNARLASKPGITGWAQVNNVPCDTDLFERVRYDIYYLEHWSLWFDIQTLFLTVFRKPGAYAY